MKLGSFCVAVSFSYRKFSKRCNAEKNEEVCLKIIMVRIEVAISKWKLKKADDKNGMNKYMSVCAGNGN